MIIADRLDRGKDIRFKRVGLLLAVIGGIGVATIAYLVGGTLRAFNDFFAMTGYSALALLIYSLEIKFIMSIFLFISMISYELYLVHILIFSLLFQMIGVSGKMEYLLGMVATVTALIVAYVYHWLSFKIQKRFHI